MRAANIGKAFVCDAQDCPALNPLGNFKGQFAIESWNLYAAPESCLGKGYFGCIYEILSLTLVDLARFDADDNVEISWRPSVLPRLAFAVYAQSCTRVHASRDTYVKFLCFLDQTFTMAGGAGSGNMLTCTMTVGAWCRQRKESLGSVDVASALAANEYMENPTSMKIAGTASAQLQKNTDAIAYLEQYTLLAPNARDVDDMYYTIAVLAQQGGDNAKACGYYQKLTGNAKYGETAKQQITALKCN